MKVQGQEQVAAEGTGDLGFVGDATEEMVKRIVNKLVKPPYVPPPKVEGDDYFEFD